ncbi:matrix metalloproteinase-14 isoform X2 [Neocloeon triangulifer]|uniref:matrix metalloproteinase-14 isoform X2 n=1 Tax=Neocloeon triangulifer TaxID=2078957 RepID=UPI00286EB62A|nr:matrix metalloproteinase-14 isoform X2 [Neocloeon triangulifer]
MLTSSLFLLPCAACLALLTCRANAAPITDVSTDPQAMMYLSQFGYLSANLKNPGAGNLITEDAMVNAIKDFQSFAQINVTGELDADTKALMSTPRCGVKDKVGTGSRARRRRYALQGSRWRVKALTYRISSYPRNVKRSEVDAELARAFNVWSEYTDLTFTPKATGQVHIDVRFARGEHGDGDPFDGPGGTLAHAYFPVYGGDAHFDDAESWTFRSYRGTNLFQVAAHEFGHSLGLSHSDVRASLMAPFYRGYDSSFRLHEDDIQAIQSLYGTGKTKNKRPSNNSPQVTETPEKSMPNDPELCKTGVKFDAIFTDSGNTYLFKGDNYWKLTEDGVAVGYPKPISSAWAGLPGNIDAAFTYNKNGRTYFFKGSQYYRFSGQTMDDGYPKMITDGFQGIPSNIDAAFVWSGNGKIYFFKDTQFYRFDPSAKPPVKSNYPKLISNWAGIPDNLDSALQYTNGYTYFFKNGQYYRFNDRTFAVDSADPAFPRAVGPWWFGCNSMNGRGGNQRQHPLMNPGPQGGDDIVDAETARHYS